MLQTICLVNEKLEWCFIQLPFVLILSYYLLFKNVIPLYFFVLQVAKSCFVPVLFGHAIDDDFIRPHHSQSIFEAYMVSFFHLVAKIQK